MTSTGFEIGDVVEWKKRVASGGWRLMIGKVVSVVPPGKLPVNRFFGVARGHKSYVVKVGNNHYWPRVPDLKPAPKDELEFARAMESRGK